MAQVEVMEGSSEDSTSSASKLDQQNNGVKPSSSLKEMAFKGPVITGEGHITNFSKTRKSSSCSRLSKNTGMPSIAIEGLGVISFSMEDPEDEEEDDEMNTKLKGNKNDEKNGSKSRSQSSSRGRSRTRISRRSGQGQSPSVRIQVTLHKPLNWQVSSCSSSSHPCVKKSQDSVDESPQTLQSQSLSASDSVSFSISPSSTFSKRTNPSKNGNQNPKIGKWKVRFTDLENRDSNENESKTDTVDGGDICSHFGAPCSCSSLNNSNNNNNSFSTLTPGKHHHRRHHLMRNTRSFELTREDGDSSSDEELETGLDGFEERNRLRSKSANNRAHRRKKRSTSNKNPKDGEPTTTANEPNNNLEEDWSYNKSDSHQEESYWKEVGERKKKLHSSFVVRLPQKPKLIRDLEKSRSFDSSVDPHPDPDREGSGGSDELEEGSEVMTWFKGPGSHPKSRESGMGANGSVTVDGRLKSRSQSSSALYCIGKSSGSSADQQGISDRPYPNNNYNYLNGHPGNATNGLSNSIPADLWNLPPPTNGKPFSPLTQIKYNASNQNNTILTANNNSSNPKGVKHRAMPSVVDAIIIGKTRKGSKGKNRAKLYAVSCPDVAQHTQCANTDHLHHQNLGYDYEEYPHPLSRLGMISSQGIVEEGGIQQGASTSGPYRRSSERNSNLDNHHHQHQNHHQNPYHNQGHPNQQIPISNHPIHHHHHHPNPVISNHQLTQSHPHLYLNSSNPPQISSHQLKQKLQKSNHPQYHNSTGGPISASYQHLPSYFVQQEPFNHYQSSSNITHHPPNPINQRGRSSLPNEDKSDFDKLQDQQPCSLFPIPTFVVPDNIFEIKLQRDQRGLGLSVTGGLDSQEKYPGLIRIKKVFPMSPASQSGGIRSWDIILQANGVPLTGLTNHEALEVLRTTPAETILTLCRPPPNVPGFLDTVDHSCSQSHNEIHSPPQQFADPPNSEFSYNQPSSNLRSNSSGSAQNPQKQFSGQYDNEGYTSGNSINSSAFNPTAKSKSLSSLKIPILQPPPINSSYGEFEVTLGKVAGSLGFTLRQEDTSVLGHYVRALVKDPALSDGRIKPGDRIISVNGQDLSEMSHADAINFLRQCPLEVTLRLYRDTSPTPISPLSPVESHKSIKAKPLRQEALDMLNDLAIRKQMSSPGTDPKHSSSAVGRTGLRSHKVSQHDANCPATLPRRRHPAVTPSPEVLSAALSRFAGGSPAKTAKSSRPAEKIGGGQGDEPNYPTETRSSGSGESTPVGTIVQTKTKKTDPYKGYSDLRSDSIISRGTTRSINEDDDGDLTSDFDELNNESNSKKKTSFRQFTLHLDQISSLDDESSFHSDLNHHDSIVSEPGGKRDGSNFRHGQPAYQSAIVPSTANKNRGKGGRLKDNFGSGFRLAGGDSLTALSDIDIPSSTYSSSPTVTSAKDTQQNGRDNDKKTKASKAGSSSSTAGSSSSASDSNNPGSLLKWKGIQFSKDDEEDTETTASSDNLDSKPLRKPVESLSGNRPNSQYLDIGSLDKKHLPQRRSPDGREFRECEMEISSTSQLNGDQIFTVQLSRRWCSRLGFSLQGTEGHTYISAIYPDSVAAKDGRLRVGDEIIMVNGETIRDMNTTEVIDIMRKTRGIIGITLLRKPSSDLEISDSELGLR